MSRYGYDIDMNLTKSIFSCLLIPFICSNSQYLCRALRVCQLPSKHMRYERERPWLEWDNALIPRFLSHSYFNSRLIGNVTFHLCKEIRFTRDVAFSASLWSQTVTFEGWHVHDRKKKERVAAWIRFTRSRWSYAREMWNPSHRMLHLRGRLNENRF